MSRKDELLKPGTLKEVALYYEHHTLLETAQKFRAAHKTIKEVLAESGVSTRNRGQHTSITKTHMAAFRCAKLIREYPKSLHKKILEKTKEFIT